MIRFQSKAGADIWMLHSHAEEVLSALGREPTPEGIFEPSDIDAALTAFAASLVPAEAPAAAADAPDDLGDGGNVDLSRRAWPLLQLLRRAQSLDHPVVWSST